MTTDQRTYLPSLVQSYKMNRQTRDGHTVIESWYRWETCLLQQLLSSLHLPTNIFYRLSTFPPTPSFIIFYHLLSPFIDFYHLVISYHPLSPCFILPSMFPQQEVFNPHCTNKVNSHPGLVLEKVNKQQTKKKRTNKQTKTKTKKKDKQTDKNKQKQQMRALASLTS